MAVRRVGVLVIRWPDTTKLWAQNNHFYGTCVYRFGSVVLSDQLD